MFKYLKNIVIIFVILLGINVSKCYATVVTDSNGDFVSDSSNHPVSDTNGPALMAPNITTQPVNVAVKATATATFSVVAVGNPTPTYQWLQEAPGASSFTVISGATSASYTTPATTTANSSTQYECVVSSLLGSVTSNVATLFVEGVPSIITQPVSISIMAPETATFNVLAAGMPDPTYQWQKKAPGASSFTVISGATSASYTTPATTTANSSTQYECVVSNALGSVTSSVVTLTVNPPTSTQPPSEEPPEVAITSPANQNSFTAGSNIKIIAQASVTEGRISKVAFYNGTILLGTVTSSPYTYTLVNAAEGTYNLTAVATGNTGLSNTSSVVSITVIPPTSTLPPHGEPPVITTQPVNATVTTPVTATFTVVATGTPLPTYQWQQEASGATTYTAISGATSASYTTPATTMANNGTQYECVVSNSTGSVTSSAATLTVKSIISYIQSVNYNANGQITQIQYGNGVTTAYTYNPLNFRLMRIYTSNAQAQVIQDLNYLYDSVGQLLSITDNVNTGNASMSQTFAYDALNRLTSASGSYGNKTYAYDSIGNVTQKDGLTYNYAEANSRTNGTAAGPHAVTSLSDGTIFKYDLNGNMVNLQKGSKLTKYAYDSQNRLQSVVVGGLTAATYAYDGDGGRTQKTVYRRDLALYNDNVNATLFGSVDNPLPATAQDPAVDTTLYVGNVYETESATDGSSRNTNSIYLGDTKVASVDSSGNIFYYHTDHLGGTNVLTDQTGEVRELTEYDPFGQVITHEKYGNDFATAWYYFTGKPLDDETGLIFLGARYYNPSLGRFITPDTVVQAAGNPQTLNRYTYCNNNPVNLVDPSGHSWWSNFWKSVGKIFEDVALAIVAVAAVVLQPELAGVIGGFMAGVVTGAVVGGAIGGISSSIMGGDMGQGILTGAIGGAIFGAVGGIDLANGIKGFGAAAMHFAGGAASGAIDATISGGNAGVSALINGISAGASDWAGESNGLFKFTGNYMTDVVKQAALGGVIGGAASSALGGSFGRGFESGAVTSAIGYTANDFIHQFSNALQVANSTLNKAGVAIGRFALGVSDALDEGAEDLAMASAATPYNRALQFGFGEASFAVSGFSGQVRAFGLYMTGDIYGTEVQVTSNVLGDKGGVPGNVASLILTPPQQR